MARDPELVEILDRLLATGVVAEADLVLGVADVDLIRVGLRAMLGSISTLEAEARTGPPTHAARLRTAPRPPTADRGATRRPPPPSVRPARSEDDLDDLLGPGGDLETLLRQGPAHAAAGRGEERVDLQPEDAARGLGQLVLGLVDLLRRLMERQADRRVAAGGLRDDQVERLRDTFAALETRMQELRDVFELDEEDTTLRLPLQVDDLD